MLKRSASRKLHPAGAGETRQGRGALGQLATGIFGGSPCHAKTRHMYFESYPNRNPVAE